MAGFAGALAGVGNAMTEEHHQQVETDIANRKAAMEGWASLMNNPNATPEQQQHAMASYFGIATTPMGKNWGKFTKPYEKPVQPQQVTQPQPGVTLAPTAPANPGPQAPTSGSEGQTPGVLQGQANQLPPMTPQAGPPPPPSIQDAAQMGQPAPPVTLAPPPNPVYGGPAGAFGMERPPLMRPPGELQALQYQTEMKAKLQVFDQILQEGKAKGLSDDDAMMRASMMTGIIPRAGMTTTHPIPGIVSGTQAASMKATMPDGSPIDPSETTHYQLSRDFMNRLIATPAKADAQGTKVAWKQDANSSTGYSRVLINQFGEQVGEPKQGLVPPAGLIPKLKSSKSVMDEDGNTITTSETKPNLGGAPPNPVSPQKPKPGTPANGSGGGGRLKFEAKKRALDASTASAQKAYDQYQDALSRFNKMETMAKEGASDPTGATDVAMLAQHMGMTVGDVKSMRTGKDIIEKHLNAIGLDARLARYIDSVNTGHQLTQQQRDSFLKLAKESLDQSERKYNALDQRTKELSSPSKGGKEATPPPAPSPKAAATTSATKFTVYDPVLKKNIDFTSQAAMDEYKKKFGVQ